MHNNASEIRGLRILKANASLQSKLSLLWASGLLSTLAIGR
jgi:hypothetical protein